MENLKTIFLYFEKIEVIETENHAEKENREEFPGKMLSS